MNNQASLIQQFVDRCLAHSPRIGVVGDSMIDSYYQVEVNRISPEFKIPVMLAETDKPSKSVPGGAANVARQLLNINCSQRLVSLLDYTTEDVLKEHKIDHRDSIYAYGIQVPVKKRFYDGDFPLCRLDVERKNYGIDEESIDGLRKLAVQRYSGTCKKSDILILSDYGKGFFSDTRELWFNQGIPTIVDPKNGPLDKFLGCTIFKPNANDAKILSEGRTHKSSQCEFLWRSINCKHIVVTDGGNGVYGLEDGEFFEIKNEYKVIPRSVIGAGDAFSAFLAVAIAHGFPVRDASDIAFRAGQCYVKSPYNEPVSLYDLLNMEDPISAKYMNPPKNINRLVFCNGVFDCMHSGHLAFLRFAKSKGDRLIVALNTDNSVKKLKGDSRPIRTLKDRMHLVANLECVDFVTSFDESNPEECIKIFKPNVMVAGEEYSKYIDYNNIETHFFHRISEISTTIEINRIISGV